MRFELPEQAARCLDCACRNTANPEAVALKRHAGATTLEGLFAAIHLSDELLHVRLIEQLRAAIATQRRWCEEFGAFAADCPIERLRNMHPRASA